MRLRSSFRVIRFTASGSHRFTAGRSSNVTATSRRRISWLALPRAGEAATKRIQQQQAAKSVDLTIRSYDPDFRW
jgi:hypothetical protein